jgi:hypothetical protein
MSVSAELEPFVDDAPGGCPRLAAFVDQLAEAFGAWIFIEQDRQLVLHGAGPGVCPPPLVEAIIRKSSAPLREQVRWQRNTARSRATLDGQPVQAFELGDAATAWFVGTAEPMPSSVIERLQTEVAGRERLRDPYVERLLQPNYMRAAGTAPEAVLVFFRSTRPNQVASHLRRITTELSVRLHRHDEHLVLVLPKTVDPTTLLSRCDLQSLEATAGWAVVADDARDWTEAAAVAIACLDAARTLQRPWGHANDRATALELVVREATEAVDALIRTLPWDPDTDFGPGAWRETLQAWSDARFDVIAAAEALHIHPNSMRYRLKRLHSTLGVDLNDRRQLLALELLLTSRPTADA